MQQFLLDLLHHQGTLSAAAPQPTEYLSQPNAPHKDTKKPPSREGGESYENSITS